MMYNEERVAAWNSVRDIVAEFPGAKSFKMKLSDSGYNRRPVGVTVKTGYKGTVRKVTFAKEGWEDRLRAKLTELVEIARQESVEGKRRAEQREKAIERLEAHQEEFCEAMGIDNETLSAKVGDIEVWGSNHHSVEIDLLALSGAQAAEVWRRCVAVVEEVSAS